MDLSKLTTLRDKLLTATQFQEVQDYFLANFGKNPEFIAVGERTTHPLLEAIIAEVAKQLFKKSPPRVEQLLLTRVAEGQFLHGGMFVNGCVGSVFYFEDIHKGLICIATLDGQAHYARFSGRPMLPRSTEPSPN